MRRNRSKSRKKGRRKVLGRAFGAAVFFWAVMAATTVLMLHGGETAAVAELPTEEIQRPSAVTVVASRGAGDIVDRYGSLVAQPDPSVNHITLSEEGQTLVVDSLSASEAEEKTAEASPDTADKAVTEEEPESAAVTDSASPSGDPQILIYHTHATESYMPVSDGNFHSATEYGTVREAGTVLTDALKKKGIVVIHDKTMHDSPSYNKSYSRSLETAQLYLAKYPSIEIVIDLHRDAAAYSGNKGYTFAQGGQTCSQFSLVVGMGNDNAQTLMSFAQSVLDNANGLYPGCGRSIIKKEYKYNQWVSDHHLLLELGNNKNTIQEVDRTAKLLADVFEKMLAGE